MPYSANKGYPQKVTFATEDFHLTLHPGICLYSGEELSSESQVDEWEEHHHQLLILTLQQWWQVLSSDVIGVVIFIVIWPEGVSGSACMRMGVHTLLVFHYIGLLAPPWVSLARNKPIVVLVT